MSLPWSEPSLTSRPKSERFLRSRPWRLPSRFSRESIEPVATAYETPPSDTKRAISATTNAGDALGILLSMILLRWNGGPRISVTRGASLRLRLRWATECVDGPHADGIRRGAKPAGSGWAASGSPGLRRRPSRRDHHACAFRGDHGHVAVAGALGPAIRRVKGGPAGRPAG